MTANWSMRMSSQSPVILTLYPISNDYIFPRGALLEASSVTSPSAACDCHPEGSSGPICNKTGGQCTCRTVGSTGRQCDR